MNTYSEDIRMRFDVSHWMLNEDVYKRQQFLLHQHISFQIMRSILLEINNILCK